jgi:hypothetical protein
VLTEEERKALTQWYSETTVLETAKTLIDEKRWDRLEDYLHKGCLMPLGRHDRLPDYMRNPEGEALFADNLDPRVNLEKWQDAVEVAWAVMKDKLGFAHDDIHRTVAQAQQSDWEAFMESVERRKKERGLS